MLPNFLVIGVAKAGTTALHWYLAEHPEVFMSSAKDPSYFAYGVDGEGRLLWGEPEFHTFPVRSLAEYERLFADVGDAVAIGEASTMYLECPQAARRIRKQIPSAKIICSLRHPVERAYSNYVMWLRHRGRSFDPSRDLRLTADWARPDSRWMRVGRYHEQLVRYFDVFPREQIHVMLFDDLKRSELEATQNVYRFVGVDHKFMPDFRTPHAIGGLPANRLLEEVLTNPVLRTAMRPLVPVRAANWVRRLRARNLRKAPSLPPELRHDLTRHFRDDIARTSALIGRSLEHWV